MQNLKLSLGIRRNVLMLKILQSSMNDRIFLCLFLPPGRLKSSLTWREGWTDCPLRSLSQSLWELIGREQQHDSAPASVWLYWQDRCLSMLNAALQFSPVTWQGKRSAKWTVAPVLRSQNGCPPWKSPRHSCEQGREGDRGKGRDQRNGEDGGGTE